MLLEWVRKTGLTKNNAATLLFDKANDIYKQAYGTDIPAEQAAKMRIGLWPRRFRCRRA